MDKITEMFSGLTRIIKDSPADSGAWESELLNSLKSQPSVRVRFFKDDSSHRAWVIDLAHFDLEITKTQNYDPDRPKNIVSPEETGGFWRLIDQELVKRTVEYGGVVLLATFVRDRGFINNVTDVMVR